MRPVIGFRGRCCNLSWWGTSFLPEDLGQNRPASVRVSGVSSRRSVEPGPCNHSSGAGRLERPTQVDVSSNEGVLGVQGLGLPDPEMDWPKMDWPKLDWPKLVKSGWPKRDWPSRSSSVCVAVWCVCSVVCVACFVCVLCVCLNT